VTESPLVVAHYLDGRLQKGTTQDFNPSRPAFHLIPPDGGPVMEILCRLLKAIFFVKDLHGNAKRQDLRGFIAAPASSAHGKKLAVRFKDGEVLCGYTLSFRPDREGFFLFPADAAGNNVRIYIAIAATAEIKAGPAAEALARDALAAAQTRKP
jgi:hypothetical protein